VKKLLYLYKRIRQKLTNYILIAKWKIKLLFCVSGKIKLRGNLSNLKIGKSFKCDGDLWIGIYSDDGEISICDNVSASGPLIITAISKVTIGSNTLFGPNVFLSDHLHGNPKSSFFFETLPSNRELFSQGPIEIFDAVHFGINVVVLGGTTVEENVVVGANSLVRGHLLSNSIYFGAPARLRGKGTC
jgi:acetyltransferase-like isoleucine patch superfamily enzyme